MVPVRALWEKLHDRRTQHFCQSKGHGSPYRDKEFEFRIRRRKVWHAPSPHQKKLVRKRTFAHVPLRLESIRTGPQLAAAEIEMTYPHLQCSLHDFPIHKVVGCDSTAFHQRPTEVRQNPIPEAEAKNGSESLFFMPDGGQLTLLAKLLQNDPEHPLRENWRSQVMKAVRINLVESVELLVV